VTNRLLLEVKYPADEWPVERLEDKRRKAHQRYREHDARGQLAEAEISDAYVADSKGLVEGDLDAPVEGENVKRVQKEIGQAYSKRWRAALVGLEVDHVLRSRKMGEVTEQRRELSPKIAELEKKCREIEQELNVVRSENQSLSYQQQDLRGDMKGQLADYAIVARGPDFSRYRRLLKSIGAGG